MSKMEEYNEVHYALTQKEIKILKDFVASRQGEDKKVKRLTEKESQEFNNAYRI